MASLPKTATTTSSSSTTAGAAAAAAPPSSSSQDAAAASTSKTKDPTTGSNGNKDETAPVTVDQMDPNLLPVVHDIFRIIEKDNQDVSQKNKDSLEASHKINEVGAKIAALRQQIYRLPGVEKDKEEQLRQLEVLRSQLASKKKLILKYKNLNLKVCGLSVQNTF